MGGRNNKLKDQKGLDQKGSGRQRNPATGQKDHFKIILIDREKHGDIFTVFNCRFELYFRIYFISFLI